VKYAGICVARYDTVKHTTGDMLDPITTEISGVSKTLPRPCEKYIDDRYSFCDVFMPEAGNTWVSFTSEEFDQYFIVVNGWTPE